MAINFVTLFCFNNQPENRKRTQQKEAHSTDVFLYMCIFMYRAQFILINIKYA